MIARGKKANKSVLMEQRIGVKRVKRNKKVSKKLMTKGALGFKQLGSSEGVLVWVLLTGARHD